MYYSENNLISDSSIEFKSWKSQQTKLYRQIQAFEIDQPGVTLPFSKRLARDHQWSLSYTGRVIEEYKKFLFLAVVADHPVAPSNAVDQAWHLHLTYTHSYWDDLCARILSRPLHHHPAQGGARELFWDCYSKTLDSYESIFGYSAPADIWPSPAVRFWQAGILRQVSSQDYWMIPRPNLAFLQQISSDMFRQLGLRVLISLAIGLLLLLALDFLAVSACPDWISALITPPAAAQVSASVEAPTHPAAQPSQDFRWSLWFIPAVLVLSFLSVLKESWCPTCKRFWLVQTTTLVVRKPTEQQEGEELITRRCKCCRHTRKEHRKIPQLTDSDLGCVCI